MSIPQIINLPDGAANDTKIVYQQKYNQPLCNMNYQAHFKKRNHTFE